jgi:hypothetical protein
MASQQQFQELIDNGQFDSISYFPKINPDEDFPINCSLSLSTRFVVIERIQAFCIQAEFYSLIEFCRFVHLNGMTNNSMVFHIL